MVDKSGHSFRSHTTADQMRGLRPNDEKSSVAPNRDPRLPVRSDLAADASALRAVEDRGAKPGIAEDLKSSYGGLTAELAEAFGQLSLAKLVQNYQKLPDSERSESVTVTYLERGMPLSEVPEHLRTETVCIAAMGRHDADLSDVPLGVRMNSRAVCDMGIRRPSSHLSDVPAKFQDQAMLELAVISNGDNLSLIPRDKRTVELCELAVASKPNALVHVPSDCMTDKMCAGAVRKNFKLLDRVPEDHRTNTVLAWALLGSRNRDYLDDKGLPGTTFDAVVATARQLDQVRAFSMGL